MSTESLVSDERGVASVTSGQLNISSLVRAVRPERGPRSEIPELRLQRRFPPPPKLRVARVMSAERGERSETILQGLKRRIAKEDK